MTIIRKMLRNKLIRYAYLGWLAIALFYLYQYILRVSPGVLVEDIRQTYKITAEQFGTLGAYYLLAYSLLQIPLGIIVDRIGVRNMCMASIALCILGAHLFSIAQEFYVAQIARAIIGAGSASAFMCALKFISDHIPPGRRGLLMGATLAFGTMGAISMAQVVPYLDVIFDWRSVMHILGVYFGIALLILIYLSLNPEKNNIDSTHNSFANLTTEFKKILSNKSIILYAVLAVGVYTPLSALADLWGVAFIRQKYELSKADAAQYVMLLYIGLTIGSLILPWVAERFKAVNLSIAICSLMLMGLITCLLYMRLDSNASLAIILLLLGFFCGAEMMCFTGALVNSTQDNSGKIVGVVNTVNMLCGAILQFLIGYILDLQFSGTFDANGVKQYSTLEYEYAFSILAIVVGLCFVISLLLFKNKATKI